MKAENILNGHPDIQEPAQVVQAFLAAHDVAEVKLTLLAALQGYALNEKKGFLEIAVSEKELAALFDNLVSLVAALQKLSADGKIIVAADSTA